MVLRWRTAEAGETFATLRRRMLHNITLMFVLMATPAVLISLSRAATIGWRPFMAAHLGLFVASWTLLFLSGRLSYGRHVVVLLTISLLAGLFGYVEIGPAADGKVLLISTSMMAALFLPARWVWLMWSTIVACMLALAAGAVSGWLEFDLNYAAYSRHPMAWINAIWTIAFLAGMVAYVAREMVACLAGSDARQRAMFDSMSEAVVVQAADGSTLQANPAAHQLLGRDGALRLNDPAALAGLYSDAGEPMMLCDLPGRAEALAGRPQAGTVIGLVREGRRVHLRCRTAPLRTAGGGAIRATISTVLDVTEQVEAQSAIEQALRATELTSQAKSDFVANVSHEIRTPMNAVIGMSHLLMGSELDSRQLGQVRKIRSAADGLLGVLNDVLDYSRIEAGQLRLEATRLCLDQLVERVLSVVGSTAADRALELSVQLEPAFPPALVGDPLRLAQVLINLLSNAIKFTEKGWVLLQIKCEPVSESHCSVTVRCEDTGIGIASDRLETILQPFTQADGSITRRFGGTGLGLSICGRLIELMGGRLEIESSPGHGSCFSFHLELPRAACATEGIGAIEGQVVLICGRSRQDDILHGYLEQMALEVERIHAGSRRIDDMLTARRGQTIWWLLEDGRVDRDGQSWSQLIGRELEAQPGWRLLLWAPSGADASALETQSTRLQVLESPILPSALRRSFMFLGGAKSVGAVAQNLPDLDQQRLLVVDDNAINREVVGEVLRRAGASVTYAANGLQAVRVVCSATAASLPTLVLMDLQMPIMDGLQAARCIREKYSAADLPIVALTAHAMEEERDRVLANGMQERLTKPVDPEHLLQRVAFWLGVTATKPTGSSEAESALTAAVVNETAPEILELKQLPGLNYPFGLKQVMGNEALYRQMLGRFAERYADASHRLQQAGAAVRSADNRRLLHSLKGMAATLGMEAIAEQARLLEECVEQGAADDQLRSGLERLGALLAALQRALDQEAKT